MKKWSLKKIILLGIMVIVCLLLMIGIGVMAATPGSTSQENDYVLLKDVDVDTDTVLIGTHLIHVDALTAPVYRIALKSQSEYGQYQMYYKSSLSEDEWVEISSVDSLSEMADETPVDKEIMNTLKVSYLTNQTGKTTYLPKKQSVSLFAIDNPADPENFSKLSELKNTYQTIKNQKTKTDDETAYLKVVMKLFEKIVLSDEVSDIEDQIDGLLYYKGQLLEDKRSHEYVEKVDTVTEQEDAMRRIKIYAVLDSRLKTLDQEIAKIQKELLKKTVSENKLGLELYEQLHGQILRAQENISDSNSYYAALVFESDGSVVGVTESKYTQKLLDAARDRDTEVCETSVRRLCNLEHILSGKMIDTVGEKALIKNELVLKAKKLYKEALSADENPEFARTEYQVILKAYFARMKNETAQQYVLDMIDDIGSFRELAEKEEAQNSVELFLLFLNQSYTELVQDAYGNSEQSDLFEQKEKLELERKNALDAENIELANQLKMQIDELQQKIDEITDKMLLVLADDASTETEKAKAQAALMEHSSASIMNALADSICLALGYTDQTELRQDKKENTSSQSPTVEDGYTTSKTTTSKTVSGNSVSSNSVSSNKVPAKEEYVVIRSTSVFSVSENNIEILKDTNLNINIHAKVKAYAALAQLDTASAQATVKKIQKAFDNATNKDADLAVEVAQMLADVEYAIAIAPKQGELAATDFVDYWEEASSDKERAAVILALSNYGETYHNAQAVRMAGSYASKEADNPYIYLKCNKKAGEYVSLKAISNALNMRYLYKDGNYQVSLQKAGKVYAFDSSKLEVAVSDGNVIELKKKPVLMEDMYILNDDATELFGVKAMYLTNGSRAIAYTADMEQMADELLERMKKGEGYGEDD